MNTQDAFVLLLKHNIMLLKLFLNILKTPTIISKRYAKHLFSSNRLSTMRVIDHSKKSYKIKFIHTANFKIFLPI